jgi:hypothetical protein
MTTLRQIEANRRNGILSRGPKTAEGKERSSKNAIQHDLTAQTIVLPNEDASLYELLRDNLVDDYTPQNGVEIQLVENIAATLFRPRRVPALEAALFEYTAYRTQMIKDGMKERMAKAEERNGRLPVTPAVEIGKIVTFLMDEQSPEKLGRYETALQRRLFESIRQLDETQARRHGKAAQPKS